MPSQNGIKFGRNGQSSAEIRAKRRISAELWPFRPNFNSLPVRGLTELTREGEVPVWGVKWPVVSVRPSVRPVEAIPKTVPATYMSRTCI